MSKYIVEIERVPSLEDYSVDLRPDTVNGEHTMFRISGIDHLVFDKSCMKSFEPVEALIDSTHHSSYEQGYGEGVERGKEIGRLESTAKSFQEGLLEGEKAGVAKACENFILFAKTCGIVTSESAATFSADLIASLNGKRTDRIVRVGDEVEFLDSKKKVIVTHIPKDDPQRIHYLDKHGKTYANNSNSEFKRTGRHFPIEDMLKEMEGES